MRVAAVASSTTPDEARERLGRELLRPEYHEQNLLERMVEAVERWFAQAVEGAAQLSYASLAGALLVGLALVLALAAVLSRLHRSRRARALRPGAAFGEVRLSAAEHRRSAEEALAREAYAECVTEAFRAAVLRPVETGALVERPGSTASELAADLGRLDVSPDGARRQRVRALASVFDAVVYGHRPATPEQAREALAVDAEWQGVLQ
jgi:hypothetical protein